MARQPAQPKIPAAKSVTQPSTAPDIESAVREALDGVVSRASLNVAVERVTAVMISEHFSGPLPHPKHLAGYEAVAPGSADRIITMAEKSVAAYISNQQLLYSPAKRCYV